MGNSLFDPHSLVPNLPDTIPFLGPPNCSWPEYFASAGLNLGVTKRLKDEEGYDIQFGEMLQPNKTDES